MENKDNAIEVRNVKKHFKVYYDRGVTLKDKMLSNGRSRYEKRQILDGISFDVKKGEAVGLIGRNGCGKSTTLKLLSKIIYPNEGTVELSGRVSSLLELGAGFHPDMSGRENIYMNAAVFGLTRKEIDKRVEDIIRFSELEEYIDNPIRTYSSGMYMRLAFSVAINVDADILLIDEILAVGDISYQKKCFEKLKEIKMNGTTIVIVSHSLDQIEKICDRSIWISDGIIKEEGNPRDIHSSYLYDMEQERLSRFQQEQYGKKELSGDLPDSVDGYNSVAFEDALHERNCGDEKFEHLKNNLLDCDEARKLRRGNKKVFYTDAFVTDSEGKEKLYFKTGESINLYLKYRVSEKEVKGTFCCLIYSDNGVYCYGTNSFIEKRKVMDITENGYIHISFNEIPLLPGKYYFSISIHDEYAVPYDEISKAAVFQIYDEKGDEGIARISTEWEMF